MPTYRAKCWLGSSSGYQDLEVKANTITGAKEQFQRIYGAEQVVNISEVRNYGSVNSGSSSGLTFNEMVSLAGFAGAIWVFLTFTPWILMSLGGVIGVWISQKMVGQEIGEYFDHSNNSKTSHLKMAFVLFLTLSFGGLGFYQGNNLQKSFEDSGKTEQIKK